jgi:hypothetical protein
MRKFTTRFMAAAMQAHVERAAVVIGAKCDRVSRRLAVGRRAAQQRRHLRAAT